MPKKDPSRYEVTLAVLFLALVMIIANIKLLYLIF